MKQPKNGMEYTAKDVGQDINNIIFKVVLPKIEEFFDYGIVGDIA